MKKKIRTPTTLAIVLVIAIVAIAGGYFAMKGVPTPTYTLTTHVYPPGSGSVSPSSGTYEQGTSVTLTASPAPSYAFDYWSGDASGTSSTTTIIINSDKDVTANFKKITYTLTTRISPLGSGSVSPSSGTYKQGTSLTLTATTTSGYLFDHWGGDAFGTSPSVTITMNSDKDVTAYFKEEIVDGKILDMMCPSSVEGITPFMISVEVQNTGNVESNFEVELSALDLEIVSRPTSKIIAPGKLKAFEFTARPIYTGQPEVSTTLHFNVVADGRIVDSRSWILKIFMPKLEFTVFEIEPVTEWFGRWWVFKLDLELTNLGKASATNVWIKATLLEGVTIADEDSAYIEYLGPGSFYSTTLTLDYAAFHTYRISIEGRCYEGSYDLRKSDEFMAYPDLGTLQSILSALSWIITFI